MFVIDEIIDNIAKIENINTKETFELDISELPPNIKEGNILTFDGQNYIINKYEEIKRKNSIRDRFNKLKNNN